MSDNLAELQHALSAFPQHIVLLPEPDHIIDINLSEASEWAARLRRIAADLEAAQEEPSE